MLRMKRIDISCILLKEGRFFLYAFEGERLAPPWRWVPALFHWHKSSFFGTDVEVSSIRTRHGKRLVNIEGVVIDTFQALELFGTEPFNRFIQWEFDDFSQRMLAVSPVIFENIVAHRFEPDFSAWHDGVFRWKVPDAVWEEFLPAFWDTPLLEEELFYMETANEPVPSMREFVRKLFHVGAESYLSRQPNLHRKWLER